MSRSERIAGKIRRGCYRGARREAKAWRRYVRAVRAEIAVQMWSHPAAVSLRKVLADIGTAFRLAGETMAMAFGALVSGARAQP